MMRCATCPYSGVGKCFAESRGLTHVCRAHARGDTSWAAILTGERRPTPATTEGMVPAARPSRPDPYPPGIGIKVNACEHRECNTGCRLTVCRAGKGDRDHGHRTTFANCVACITAQ